MAAPAVNLHGGAYPVRDGNQFTPIVDILPTYRAICTAADSAQRSVWVVISFIDPNWQLPDKRGTCLEYLERLAQRGLDVRILAWNNPAFYSGGFLRADQALPHLEQRDSRIKVRWDHSPDERHCHHEKSWIIDGLTLLEPGRSDSCQAFTGGIVIGGPLTGPDHAERTALRHDIFSCLTGPSMPSFVVLHCSGLT
jgi:cardiolipin synthase